MSQVFKRITAIIILHVIFIFIFRASLHLKKDLNAPKSWFNRKSFNCFRENCPTADEWDKKKEGEFPFSADAWRRKEGTSLHLSLHFMRVEAYCTLCEYTLRQTVACKRLSKHVVSQFTRKDFSKIWNNFSSPILEINCQCYLVGSFAQLISFVQSGEL